MEEPTNSPRPKHAERVLSPPQRRQRASTPPSCPAASPKRSPRSKGSKTPKSLTEADIPPLTSWTSLDNEKVHMPSPTRRSSSEPRETMTETLPREPVVDTPSREDASRLTTFLSTPLVQCIRKMIGAGRSSHNSADDDQTHARARLHSPECDVENGIARSPGLQRTGSRFHLSVTSPKPQQSLRELVRGKSKKQSGKPEKKQTPGSEKKNTLGKGTVAAELTSNVKPTSTHGSQSTKVSARKKLPAPNQSSAGKRKLLDSAQTSKSKQPKMDAAPAKKVTESKKQSDKVLPSQQNGPNSPRRQSLAENSFKKTSTSEKQVDSCIAAIGSTAPIGNGDADAALGKQDVESKRTVRSPSRPKRGRSASPEPDKSAKKKNQAPSGASTTTEQSTAATKKRRHSLPSSIRVDQPATSSTSRKASKSGPPPMPDDPNEAFALYMQREDSPSEVLPGLWLGGFNAWYRGNDLLNSECREVDNIPRDMFFRHHDISNVVSLGSWHPKCADFPGMLEDVAHLDIDDCSVGDDRPAERLCDDFERLVTKMIEWRLSDKKVYVHCRAGQSRSATIVVAYYAVIFNFPAHEAIAHLYQLRPGPVGILPGQQFLKALKTWETSDTCQKTRERFRNEPGRVVRLKRDIRFLAEHWQHDLRESEDYVDGMFAGLVRNVLPEFVYEPRRHLLALINLALSLPD